MGQVPSPRGETESVDPLHLGIAAEPALPAGTLVGGRHRIGAVLGRGGYAVVYRACDEATGTAVALKVLRADRVSGVAVRRLQREAETAAALDHPGLVRVLDHGIAEQGPYLAMELVEGAEGRPAAPPGSVAIYPPSLGASRPGLATSFALERLVYWRPTGCLARTNSLSRARYSGENTPCEPEVWFAGSFTIMVWPVSWMM